MAEVPLVTHHSRGGVVGRVGEVGGRAVVGPCPMQFVLLRHLYLLGRLVDQSAAEQGSATAVDRPRFECDHTPLSAIR